LLGRKGLVLPGSKGIGLVLPGSKAYYFEKPVLGLNSPFMQEPTNFRTNFIRYNIKCTTNIL